MIATTEAMTNSGTAAAAEAMSEGGEVTADTADAKGWMLGSMHLCDSCNGCARGSDKVTKADVKLLRGR